MFIYLLNYLFIYLDEEVLRLQDYETFTLLTDLRRNEILHFRDSKGNSLLHIAAMHDVSGPIRLMVAIGIPVDILNYMENTPLSIAVDNKSLIALKYLIEQGADLLQVDRFGIDIFFHARSRGHHDLIPLLKG